MEAYLALRQVRAVRLHLRGQISVQRDHCSHCLVMGRMMQFRR